MTPSNILKHQLKTVSINSSTQQGLEALKGAIQSSEELARRLSLNEESQAQITKTYKVRVPEYYLNLIQSPHDPIWKQAIPDLHELDEDHLPEDPFEEDASYYSPTPHLTHRYPDRALLLVTDVCPMYCRYCMRKRKTQKKGGVSQQTVLQGIDYIRKTPQIREVILSGGDPMMLSDRRLEEILQALHQIPHLDLIRIHTRMPCVQPQRITPELGAMLSSFHPLFIVVHFNHPRELTPEASQALSYLADSGIPLSNQSVLLKGVNDDPQVMKQLCLGLLKRRVRPYYLHQADLVHGTDHFRTRVETGVEIIRQLQGQISGLAIPQFVIDGPGGGGKVPLMPDQGQQITEKFVILKNCEGKTMIYPQIEG
ncbi:KamA family radical SAM protein [Deltaproteobacteria bacterium TL4]